MAGTSEAIAALVPGLSAAAAEALTHGARAHMVAKGATLLERGDAIPGAYLVTAGALRVYSVAPSGAQWTLYTMRRGDSCVLAIDSLFSGAPYPAWVEANEQSRVLVVPAALFRDLFEREAPIRALALNGLSRMVTGVLGAVGESHGASLTERCHLLLGRRADAGGTVAMTQQAIANELGTSREVVARILGAMRTRGEVKTGRGTVIVVKHPP